MTRRMYQKLQTSFSRGVGYKLTQCEQYTNHLIPNLTLPTLLDLKPEFCDLKPEIGPCKWKWTRYFYNESIDDCSPFEYGGQCGDGYGISQ